jgi:putative AbiEii toxin of type IV toxin-antitoxin system/OLD-like protein
MQQLSDFKPLQRVVLPDLGDLRCSGLIVIVGPNSSGKSQLLQDLYRRLVGEPRKLVVANDVNVGKPPFEPLMKCLESEGYFSTLLDDNGTAQLRPRTMHLGSGQAVNQIPRQIAEQWYSGYSPETLATSRPPNEFLSHFGKMLVTSLFLERRLVSLGPVGVIDFENQGPQHDLHALYIDDKAQQLLWDEAVMSFGSAVWPDMSKGNLMMLRVGEGNAAPSPSDRLSFAKMSTYRSIDTEGDGMKSYIAICVALLLGRRPVCLIDEPEMCLHPPQAYNLGRFIGRFGAGLDTATFVATHSSYVLRGILQTAAQVQIVRLTREQRRFSGYLVPASDLTDALTRPTLRAEAVLDGVFARSIIVVEADGDRAVYQAAWETLEAELGRDVHFSTVGGTGGIADTCRLYRTLRIPIAVIADLDMIVDKARMEKVLQSMIGEAAAQRELIGACHVIADELRSLPPAVLASDVVAELDALRNASMDWTRDEDVALKRRLAALTHRVDRMGRVKRGGVNAYSGDLHDRLSKVLRDLAQRGLFLVPVGELEQWLSGHGVEESKNNKKAWANAAAQRIQVLGRQAGDVWDFVAGVGAYLNAGPH